MLIIPLLTAINSNSRFGRKTVDTHSCIWMCVCSIRFSGVVTECLFVKDSLEMIRKHAACRARESRPAETLGGPHSGLFTVIVERQYHIKPKPLQIRIKQLQIYRGHLRSPTDPL